MVSWLCADDERQESHQFGKLAGAVGELVGLHAHLLCDGEEDVGERRMLVGIMCDVLAVLALCAKTVNIAVFRFLNKIPLLQCRRTTGNFFTGSLLCT